MATNKLVAAKSFCLHHKIRYEFITQARDHDLIEVVTENKACYIPYEQLEKLEKMVRLHHELEINLEGIQAIMHLLDQLNQKEKELAKMKNMLAFYSTDS